jgi:hypothetical protein
MEKTGNKPRSTRRDAKNNSEQEDREESGAGFFRLAGAKFSSRSFAFFAVRWIAGVG